MQAIRIREGRTVHPEYFTSRARGGDKSPKFIDHPVGEIVESADCPSMCLGEDPFFAPHDEECKKAVLERLNSPRRRGELERLKSMYSNRDKLSAGATKYVEAIFQNHAAEIAGTTPAQQVVWSSRQPAASPATPES